MRAQRNILKCHHGLSKLCFWIEVWNLPSGYKAFETFFSFWWQWSRVSEIVLNTLIPTPTLCYTLRRHLPWLFLFTFLFNDIMYERVFVTNGYFSFSFDGEPFGNVWVTAVALSVHLWSYVHHLLPWQKVQLFVHHHVQLFQKLKVFGLQSFPLYECYSLFYAFLGHIPVLIFIHRYGMSWNNITFFMLNGLNHFMSQSTFCHLTGHKIILGCV